MSTGPFVHSELKAGHIRLLELLLPASDNKSPIEVRLDAHELPLSDAPPAERKRIYKKLPWYVALSYTWGDELSDENIYVNGQPMEVTRNLYAALRNIRASASWPVRLWVDRICINQERGKEKAAQMKLMREIYHIASMVFVSLGEAETTMSDTKDLMRSVALLTRDPLFTTASDLFFDVNSSASEQTKSSGIWATFKTSIAKPIVNKAYSGGIASLAPATTSFFRQMDVWQNTSRDEDPFEQLTSKEDPAKGITFKERYRSIKKHKAEEKMSKVIEQSAGWKPSARSLAATFSTLEPSDMAKRLEDLFSHRTRYFSRIWTLEEAAVGQQVVIECGGVLTSLNDVVHAMFYLQADHHGHFSASTISKLENYTFVNKNWTNGLRLHLQELLFLSCDRTCYDAQDNVIALLGLINDRHHPLLDVDHKRAPAEVFSRAAMFIIHTRFCLDVICWPRNNTLKPFDPPLPSWAPDFRFFASDGKLPSPIDLRGRENRFQDSSSKYYGGAIPTLTDDWRRLAVKGVVVGQIAEISPLVSPDKSAYDAELVWNATLAQQSTLPPQVTESLVKISSLLHVHRGLTQAPNDPSPANVSVEYPQNAQANSDSMDPSYLMTLMYGQLGVGSPCTFSEAKELLAKAAAHNEQALNALYTGVQTGIRDRRLVVTNDARFGSAPESACQSDMICLLQGCSMPLVLRQQPENPSECILVGSCYVAQYMNDDAMKFLEQYECELQDFILS